MRSAEPPRVATRVVQVDFLPETIEFLGQWNIFARFRQDRGFGAFEFEKTLGCGLNRSWPNRQRQESQRTFPPVRTILEQYGSASSGDQKPGWRNRGRPFRHPDAHRAQRFDCGNEDLSTADCLDDEPTRRDRMRWLGAFLIAIISVGQTGRLEAQTPPPDPARALFMAGQRSLGRWTLCRRGAKVSRGARQVSQSRAGGSHRVLSDRNTDEDGEGHGSPRRNEQVPEQFSAIQVALRRSGKTHWVDESGAAERDYSRLVSSPSGPRAIRRSDWPRRPSAPFCETIPNGVSRFRRNGLKPIRPTLSSF